MARGRMIDRSYTSSRKLNGLSRDHRYIYAGILPYLDREGRYVAEPVVLKANVFRWSDVTLDELAEAVTAFEESGLIELYADEDNGAILQYVKFREKNTPNSKEAKSDLPGPDDPTAKPVWCPEILSARASHMQSTGDATSNARAMQVENVNENENVNDNGNEKLSSNSQPTERPANPVAQARRERPALEDFLNAYNQHRGPLPAAQALNAKRKRQLKNLVKQHGDEAMALLIEATKCVAQDEYWIEKAYNLDNLLAVDGRVIEKAEKYRARQSPGFSAADAKLARSAVDIHRAIGGEGGDLN